MANMARQGIVTAGTWCVDLNKLIAEWPAEDTSNEVLAMDRQGGGSACNMAIDLRRLDSTLPVTTMGLVGDDDNGRFLLAQCDRWGIERSRLQAVADAQSLTVDAFTIRGTGRRTHFYFPGVAAQLSPDHLDFRDVQADILHLGLPGAHATMDRPWNGEGNGWAATLKAARSRGLRTNLETMTIARERLAALTAPCLPHLDFLVVNDYEIGAIAGEPTRNGEQPDVAAIWRAIDIVFGRGPLQLIVVHFPAGSLLARRYGARLAIGSVAIPQQEIVGVNGAGDAFAAGILYGQHRGWSDEQCVALAHGSAAASMRSISTTSGVGPVEDCLALTRRWGHRDAPR
jgi:sugar/nucleoside kinase (ribokinase family)